VIQLVNMLTRKVSRTLRVLPLSASGASEGGAATAVAAGPPGGAHGAAVLGVDPRLGQLLMNSGNGCLDLWDAVKGKHVTSIVAQVRNVVSSAAVSGDKKTLVRESEARRRARPACLPAYWLAGCLA
jgi:hypothetical protein